MWQSMQGLKQIPYLGICLGNAGCGDRICQKRIEAFRSEIVRESDKKTDPTL